MAMTLTGGRVFAMFAAGFGLIIGVNIALAVNAVRTFPGLETANSYVASQTFDADRGAQEALGWTMESDAADGAVVLTIRDSLGQPVKAQSLHVVLGRATTVADDVVLDPEWTGDSYRADAALAGGRWQLRVEAVADDGTRFRKRLEIGAPR